MMTLLIDVLLVFTIVVNHQLSRDTGMLEEISGNLITIGYCYGFIKKIAYSFIPASFAGLHFQYLLH